MLFIGLSIIVYVIMASNCSTAFVKCPDCDYISKSTGGLAVYRSKIHNINAPHNIKTLYINRLFPEGKPVYNNNNNLIFILRKFT